MLDVERVDDARPLHPGPVRAGEEHLLDKVDLEDARDEAGEDADLELGDDLAVGAVLLVVDVGALAEFHCTGVKVKGIGQIHVALIHNFKNN